MSKFSHLHVHTQYSLLDGAASIKGLFKKAIANNMPALAISDHGNMFGVFEFVSEAYKHTNSDGSLKVKPIVGCEFYVTENRGRKQFTKDQKDKRYHQILLAKNAEGYQNLIKLCSLGYTEGLYNRFPRIDKELILQYHKGLIATTCCLGGYVPKTITNKGEAEAEKEFKWWLDIFGEDYYIELQRHGIHEQDVVNEVLLRFAKKYNVTVIASNDSHYVDQDDAIPHDIIVCLGTGEKLDTPKLTDYSEEEVNVKGKRFAFPNDQFFVKTEAQMLETFKDIPYAIHNTQQIVDKVELLQLKKEIMLPFFKVPDNFANQDDYLKHLTYEGAKIKYSALTAEIEERISFELFTIKTMGFAGYFLIVADFIKAGKDLGVYIGPGRGSAAGSVIAYLTGITNIDPIKYQLLFERFLNPDRKSMPDIDTDFDDEGREKVINYVVEKYSKAQVAQIITYGTMAAKSSIADVARVMDIPLPDSRALTSLVPDRPGTSLSKCLTAAVTADNFGSDNLESIQKLQNFYNGNGIEATVLKYAEKLEGNVRNTGIHASAIIIAPQALDTIMPVCLNKEATLLVTQIEGNSIEDAGVIKMDFLGLRTLNILKSTVNIIQQNYGITIDIDTLPLNDALTYELYQKGETTATFQFESLPMQKHLRDLKPDKLEDLIALNALFRPGPMAYIPTFVARKHGKEKTVYDLPEMEEYLKDTYGITVYQEQVMLLAQKLANFSKGDADVLRKAMGKKQRAVLDKMKPQFINGAAANGHAVAVSNKIWGDWEAFAEYAFNKSHSTCYAYVAYQTGYLKAHYPAEYMAAVLNHSGSIEKVTQLMEECKRMNLAVLGPDVNESNKGFTVNKKQQIRFGLNGIKGVGENAVDELLAEREKGGTYHSIFDFLKRVNQKSANKKSMEALVISGAFDNFTELHRAQYFYTAPGEITIGLEKLLKFGNQVQNSLSQSINSLFGDSLAQEIPNPKLPNCPPWALTEQLEKEKEVIGMYISGHPLDYFSFELKHYGITPLTAFTTYKNAINEPPDPTMPPQNPSALQRIAGLVTNEDHRTSKAGNRYGNYTLEDYYGKTEITLFRDDYVKLADYMKKGNSVCLTLNFVQNYERTEYRLKIQSISLLETLKQTLSKQLTLNVPAKLITIDDVTFLQKNLKKNPGTCKLRIAVTDGTEQIQLYTQQKGITINDELKAYLTQNLKYEVSVLV